MSIASNRSSRRHEPAATSAIGWISTSDALLFGIGILVFFGAGMTGQLHKSQLKNAQLNDNNRELSEQLADAVVENSRISKELAKVEQQFTFTESMLASANKQIAALAKSLSVQERKNRELSDRLMVATSHYERVQSQIESLRNELRTQLEEKAELSALVERLRTVGRERIGALTAQLAATVSELDELKNKYAVQQASYADVSNKHKAAMAAIASEKQFRRELIGVKGSFSRVAILLDRSLSMQESGRWEEAKAVIRTWVDYLQMDRCVVIVFSSEVTTFPQDRKWLELGGPAGLENRKDLVRFLDELPAPDGGTNTLRALETAYGFPDIDTIVLFTDGAPNDGNSSLFDPAIASRIHDLVVSKSSIPINAVGLGDYFQPQLSSFLLDLAESTQGTFLGR